MSIDPTPYETRPIRFLDLLERDGWRLKCYGITVDGEYPEDSLVDAGLDRAVERLPTPATAEDRYGVGIVVVHEGADGNYVLVDWWYGENMLANHVFYSTRADPLSFEYISPGMMACVWELRVFAFEREAWLEHVLANPDGSDIEGYLAERLHADV